MFMSTKTTSLSIVTYYLFLHLKKAGSTILSFNINDLTLHNYKVLKSCARGELYSSESMLFKKEKPKLNTQVSGNGKIALQTIY